MIFVSHTNRGQSPGVFHLRVERNTIALDGKRCGMAKGEHRARVIFFEHCFVSGSPARPVRRQSCKGKPYGLKIQSRIYPAAAIEPAFRVAIVKIVNDPCHRYALEFVERALE